MIGSFRWIIFVWSGSHIKMANKLVLLNKEEVNYTAKTSSYSSMRFIWHTCYWFSPSPFASKRLTLITFIRLCSYHLYIFFNILFIPLKGSGTWRTASTRTRPCWRRNKDSSRGNSGLLMKKFSIKGCYRQIIFVWSGSHIKMANKLVLLNKEEVNYTAKTSSYSSMRFIWHTCYWSSRGNSGLLMKKFSIKGCYRPVI